MFSGWGLTKLILCGIRLPVLPESFRQLSNLNELWLGEYQVDDFPKELADHLKKQGCKIMYESREWIGGWGGSRETVKRDFFTKKEID